MTDYKNLPFITKKQIQRIDNLKMQFFHYNAHGDQDKYEYKTFKVEHLFKDSASQVEHKIVILTLEVGLKNDEGTYAACFARSYKQLFIGPRGRVWWYRDKKRGFGSRNISSTSMIDICSPRR